MKKKPGRYVVYILSCYFLEGLFFLIMHFESTDGLLPFSPLWQCWSQMTWKWSKCCWFSVLVYSSLFDIGMSDFEICYKDSLCVCLSLCVRECRAAIFCLHALQKGYSNASSTWEAPLHVCATFILPSSDEREVKLSNLSQAACAPFSKCFLKLFLKWSLLVLRK